MALVIQASSISFSLGPVSDVEGSKDPSNDGRGLISMLLLIPMKALGSDEPCAAPFRKYRITMMIGCIAITSIHNYPFVASIPFLIQQAGTDVREMICRSAGVRAWHHWVGFKPKKLGDIPYNCGLYRGW